MPIYEYRRPDGSTFEVLQKFSDEPLTKDPETGEPVERVFRPPAIHFKGSGFHNTDYGTRKGGGGNGGSSEGGSDSSSSKPDSGKSESKPDSKPAASTAD